MYDSIREVAQYGSTLPFQNLGITHFFFLKTFSQHNTNATRNSQKLSIMFRGKTRRTICRSKISGTSSPGRACRSQVSPRRLARPRLGPREVRGSDVAAPGGIHCPCTTVRPAQRPAAAPAGLPAAKPVRMRSRLKHQQARRAGCFQAAPSS